MYKYLKGTEGSILWSLLLLRRIIANADIVLYVNLALIGYGLKGDHTQFAHVL